MRLRSILGISTGVGVLGFIGYRLYKGKQLKEKYQPVVVTTSKTAPATNPIAPTGHLPASSTGTYTDLGGVVRNKTVPPQPSEITAYWRDQIVEALGRQNKTLPKATTDFYARVIYFNQTNQKKTIHDTLVNQGLTEAAKLFAQLVR